MSVKSDLHSISLLRSLEELGLWGNYLSRDESLSDILSKLISLEKLDIAACLLSQLPKG